jgi:hypothetical protein
MQRKGQWPAIAELAGVSYSWLCKFAVGRIENPGYDSLKRLHGALADQSTAPQSDQAEVG